MHEQVVGQLYRRHALALEAHCHRLLGYGDDASDAVHETFVRVLTRSRAPSCDEHAVRSLFRISTHVCIDVLRERDVRVRALPELSARAPSQPPGDARLHARECIERLVERCDETTSSLLALCFIEEKARGEVALTLGTTRRTVWTRLKRLERLANELAENELAAAE
jgi:RNA polymerase sigma-70 factor (ECF subfamily)